MYTRRPELLARDAAVARPTVQGYFEVLTDTLLGAWLPAWRPRARVKEVQHPKFYWFDCGVVRALSRRLREPLDSAERGHLLETLVLNELREQGTLTRCHAVYLGDSPQRDGPVSVLPLSAFFDELAAGNILPSSPLTRGMQLPSKPARPARFRGTGAALR